MRFYAALQGYQDKLIALGLAPKFTIISSYLPQDLAAILLVRLSTIL